MTLRTLLSLPLLFLLCLALSSTATAQGQEYETETLPDPAVGRIWESTAAPADKAVAAPVLRPGADGWTAPAAFDRGLLVDAKGFTLYTFDGDRRTNVSTCYGVCQTLWPPLLATPDDTARGDFSIVHRRDSLLQWAFRGKPLYRWARDRKPGDITGDKVNNVWHIVPEKETSPP